MKIQTHVPQICARARSGLSYWYIIELFVIMDWPAKVCSRSSQAAKVDPFTYEVRHTVSWRKKQWLVALYDSIIGLKGIVQRKGPVALPSSGRNTTIWLSRVYASPEPFTLPGKFGVVVKVKDYQAPGDPDRVSSPVDSKFFSWEKKVD